MLGLRMQLAAAMLLVLPWFGPPAMAAEPIKIGFSMAMTGGLAPNGKQVAAAMDLWREDVNAKGGLLGRPVQFVSYDDQSNPANVPAIYTKVIEVGKVDLIVSPYATNMVVPTIPIAMQHNMVPIGQFALAANTEFKYPRYFAIMPTGPDTKQSIADGYFDLAKQLKPAPKTVAIAYGDAEFARAMADSARLHAQQLGLKIVYDRSYPPTNTDFTPVIHAVQATNPDIVFIGSYPVDSVGLVRAAHEIGLKAQMFGGCMAGLVTTSIETSEEEVLTALNVLTRRNSGVPKQDRLVDVEEDHTKEFLDNLHALGEVELLVGIPAESNPRPDGGIGNAALAYIRRSSKRGQERRARRRIRGSVALFTRT
jgi:branched-chain amino acid transport system substrate-binding protein